MKYFKEATDRWYKEQPEWGTPESTKKAKKHTPMEEREFHVRLDHLDGDSRQKKVDDILKKYVKKGDIKYSGSTDKGLVFVAKNSSGLSSLNRELNKYQTFAESNESCCEECEELFDHVISEAEYQGKKVELNNPFRLPSGSNKKFGVYVKNDKGNVVKVTFGDPNMDIKRDSPERRKSFRARHNCADPGPKWKARYWSCYQWRASAKVDEEAPTNSTGPATATDKPVVRKKRFADFVRRDGKVS